jgi:hypothetical protein
MKPFVISILIFLLTAGFLMNFEKANAQSNSTQIDMKSIADNLNKTLTKLTGGNSSEVLKNTVAFINKTSHEIANQNKDVLNKDSLNTAEIIAKKIGIGFADVLGNISGELKQGIESK